MKTSFDDEADDFKGTGLEDRPAPTDPVRGFTAEDAEKATSVLRRGRNAAPDGLERADF